MSPPQKLKKTQNKNNLRIETEQCCIHKKDHSFKERETKKQDTQ